MGFFPPPPQENILAVHMHWHNLLSAKKLEVKIAGNKLERPMKQVSKK